MRVEECFRIFMTGGLGALASGRLRVTAASLVLLCSMMAVVIGGCAHQSDSRQAREEFVEANALFNGGNYNASLDKYRQIMEKFPEAGDRALFEMGIVYSYPRNAEKDYLKSLECLQRLVKDYPNSGYRQNGETMIFTINNVSLKDGTIAAQQAQIEGLRQEVREKEAAVAEGQKKVEELKRKVFAFATQKGKVDKILIEKNARQLSLIADGEVIKSYRIALGGNPVGAKERQGDNKTPEGCYVIDSKNRGSRYHRALHISYPNEKDKKRARELGVSPGGDIMIHGIKNGYSWVGDSQADADWTKGCIAVTDEEIEEIDRLAPNGTVVEIRP